MFDYVSSTSVEVKNDIEGAKKNGNNQKQEQQALVLFSSHLNRSYSGNKIYSRSLCQNIKNYKEEVELPPPSC